MALNNFGDQLIVRIGKACNFRCNFCNVDDNEKILKKESIDDMIRNFLYKFKYSKIDNGEIMVTISGGEPSIFKKETLFMLKFANSFFQKRNITPVFDIQTNASEIDTKFAYDLKNNGINIALVSFHTIDKDIFNSMIGKDYDIYFNKIISGIHNLHNAGIEIYLNIVLNKQNKDNLLDLLRFSIANLPFVKTYNIGFIQPHGLAQVNMDSLFVKYADMERVYNYGVYLLRHHKKNVVSHFVGLPPCYFTSIKDSLEVTENKFFKRNLGGNDKFLINSINDSNKIQTNECSKCLFNDFCGGIWKEYVGKQELNPIEYHKDFLNRRADGRFHYFLKDGDEMKKIYDSNIRQLIIDNDVFGRNQILSKTSEANSLGFYKITLALKKVMDINLEIISSGISNIQTDIKYLSEAEIFEINEYIINNNFTFGINLDLFIYEFNEDNLNKIKYIIGIMPSPKVKIYFISNSPNYKNLLSKLDYDKWGSQIFTVGFGDKWVYKKNIF